MQALVYQKYGRPTDVLKITNREKPSPNSSEILVRVHAATVNRTDEGLLTARYFVSRFFTGLFKPTKPTPGTDFSGVIETVGADIKEYSVGDEVFGFNDEIISSHAEYLILKSTKHVKKKPASISHSEAAACCEGAHYAINCLNKIKLEKGNLVMVNGGTGAIGSAAIQILKSRGIKVIATAEGKNIDLVKSLGAEQVLDYQTEDFTKQSVQFDLVLDAVGKSSFKKCQKILKPKGKYISTELGKGGANIFWALVSPFTGGKKVIFPMPSKIGESLTYITKLVENNEFHPVIDKIYPFSQIIEAYEYVSTGKKIGNVVVEMQTDEE
ncbi:MAG: NAD(P)-dependent alcohol dehydrogenase [Pseudozobellia sp.]|nr:NAD(P)-dependent alcohol dehydrogenase [Pseudozobellia sp.]|tara:strand:- start:49369 stop:50346 length:978 start_codon:yes stop_codon:yes gene_type:complete